MSLSSDPDQPKRKGSLRPQPVELEKEQADQARNGVMARIEDATLAIMQKHDKRSA